MALRVPPPDEWEFDNIQYLEAQGFGKEINAQNVLFYFYQFPWFDKGSRNWAVWSYAFNNHQAPDAVRLLTDPRAFEARLREDLGAIYVIAAEPKAPGEPFVIQKINRQRHEATGEVEEIVEGTWYTVGTKICMAPSLLDILQARLLTASSILESVFETSQSLSHWSPSTGHTYMPPNLQNKSTTVSSRAGSRAGSIAPGSPAHSQSQSQQAAAQPATQDLTTEFSDEFFMQSLSLTNRFGHEYMDENPLQGEPGSFVFASTNKQVEARNRAQAAAQAGIPAKVRDGEAASTTSSVPPTPKPGALTGAPGVAGAAAGAESRKGSVVGLPPTGKDKKRRKSKGPGSPLSPTGATGFPGVGA